MPSGFGKRIGTVVAAAAIAFNVSAAAAKELSHSFASRALALGESLPMIGKLPGHRKVDTTARYAHLARDSVHESAARIADSIAADILGEYWTVHAA